MPPNFMFHISSFENVLEFVKYTKLKKVNKTKAHNILARKTESDTRTTLTWSILFTKKNLVFPSFFFMGGDFLSRWSGHFTVKLILMSIIILNGKSLFKLIP